MSYILGSVSHIGGLAESGLVSAAAPLSIPLKAALAANMASQPNLSEYEHFNLLRFGKPLKSGAKEITDRMEKGTYEMLYAVWRTPIREGLKKMRSKSPGEKPIAGDPRPKWRNSELNDMLYAEFKSWYRMAKADLEAAGILKSSSGGSAQTQSKDEEPPAEDNTMLYVAGAAVLGLVALGAMRRK